MDLILHKTSRIDRESVKNLKNEMALKISSTTNMNMKLHQIYVAIFILFFATFHDSQRCCRERKEFIILIQVS
jgi:membrane-associated HD superfamily phosphohydrolase